MFGKFFFTFAQNDQLAIEKRNMVDERDKLQETLRNAEEQIRGLEDRATFVVRSKRYKSILILASGSTTVFMTSNRALAVG